MLHILYGEDDYSLTRALDEIKSGLGDDSLLAANTTILEGEGLTLERLRGVCETVPFLTARRLVIVYGLLARLESEGGPRRKAAPAREKESAVTLFAGYLGEIPETAELVLVDGRLKKNNPLLRRLPAAAVRAFPVLRREKLRQWLGREVAAQGATISPEAAALLAELVGGDLWLMSSEIGKLALYALDRRIEAGDVRLVTSAAQATNVFALVDAVLDGNAGRAETLLEGLLQAGVSPGYLLAMLSRQARLVVQTIEMRRRRVAEADIQKRLGLNAEFAWRKTLAQAQRYSLERLREVYHRLLETDLAIKTGRYDGGLALNLLIADLCPQGVGG